MSGFWGILILIVALIISVALHEVGHLLPAKLFGTAVSEYSVGFGPSLWQKTWKGTRYVLRPILLGGYVRILAMFAPAPQGVRTTKANGEPTLAQRARQESSDEYKREGSTGTHFYSLNPIKKIVIMVGGPVMNLLICVALAFVAMECIGIPTATTTISTVPRQVVAVTGKADSPATHAGIRSGDVITACNGQQTAAWEQVKACIQGSHGQSINMEVRRDRENISLSLTPIKSSNHTWVTGIVSHVENRPVPPAKFASGIWDMFTGTVSVVVQIPKSLWDGINSLFSTHERPTTGVMSVVGVGQVAAQLSKAGSQAGPSMIPEVTASFLLLIASLNMALFVFNLIPLLPLDGGHIAGACVEGIRKISARLSRRPDPGPIDMAKWMPVTYVVVGVLIVMTIVLMAVDVINPIRILN